MAKIGTMEDVLKDAEFGGYDFSKGGKCSNCGNCCSNLLPVQPSEINRIKNYIKKHNIKEHRIALFANDAIDLTCPFRDEGERKCSIYKVRPLICRQYFCHNVFSGKKTVDKELLQASTKEQFVVIDVRETFFGG